MTAERLHCYPFS